VNRTRLYGLVNKWTSPLLFILMALQLLTGLGSIKGRQLALVTAGLFNPANAGKLHTVWLVLVTGIVIYLHGIAGIGLLIRRSKLIRNKTVWEVVLMILSLALFVQFIVLFLLK
jgi:hypothetical protein